MPPPQQMTANGMEYRIVAAMNAKDICCCHAYAPTNGSRMAKNAQDAISAASLNLYRAIASMCNGLRNRNAVSSDEKMAVNEVMMLDSSIMAPSARKNSENN